MDTANCAMLERRSYWQDQVEQWQSSGMTQVAYCCQQGVNLAQFRYWKKRLLPTRSPDTAIGAAPEFIAVQMASTSTTLTVVLNDHLRVEVHPGFDPATLRAVVQALSPDVPA